MPLSVLLCHTISETFTFMIILKEEAINLKALVKILAKEAINLTYLDNKDEDEDNTSIS